MTEIGRRGEGDEGDRWGPHGSDVRERDGVVAGMHKVEGNTPFGKYAKAAQAEWAECRHDGLRGKSGPTRARLGRMGRNLKRILFRIKIGFLNIPRLWKFTQGDFGGILT
jgi:hypothetical protein